MPDAPYNEPIYRDYTKLNASRMNRWLKKGKLEDALVRAVQGISSPQQWIVITEPWCGDAAHSVPFVELASRLNPLVSVVYELRDSPPLRINEYLTHGSKSIPKVIIRDNQGNDVAVWGPRPAGCQQLFDRLKAEGADFERQKVALQQWYNADNGKSVQAELAQLLNKS